MVSTRHSRLMREFLPVGFTEIAAAALTGLLSGVAGSVIAPWSQWGVERKRERRVARVNRIAEWREGVANLRQAEEHAAPMIPFNPGPGIAAGFLQVDSGALAPDPHAIGPQGWFITLESELSGNARDRVAQLLRNTQAAERRTQLSALLEREVARIEREAWKLV